MKKQMKFLICGFGNIAQRHFRNLKTLLPDCKIDIYREVKNQYRIFDDKLNITCTDDLKKRYDINNIYSNFIEALDAEIYNAVFICTLPPLRLKIAEEAVNRGFNLFIEKPLATTLDGIEELEDKIQEVNLKCAIGYQMRFHPILQLAKRMIKANKFGEIYRIELVHCNSIYNWTHGRNLKDFYALKKSNGGGVILSQIHELDYLEWLFGYFDAVGVVGSNCLSKYNYGVEENVTILGNTCAFNSISASIPTTIHLDFLSKIPRRTLKIYGMKQSVEVDIIKGLICDMDNRKILYTSNKLWNELFLDEMKAFLKSLNGKWQKPLADIFDGISSLTLALEIKEKL